MTDYRPRLFVSDAAVERVGEGFLARNFRARSGPTKPISRRRPICFFAIPRSTSTAELPGLIRRYNESVGGVNSDTEGYHDTITRVFLHGIRLFLAKPTAMSRCMASSTSPLLSPMGRRDWPFRFYSRDRLFSFEARKHFRRPRHGGASLIAIACYQCGINRGRDMKGSETGLCTVAGVRRAGDRTAQTAANCSIERTPTQGCVHFTTAMRRGTRKSPEQFSRILAAKPSRPPICRTSTQHRSFGVPPTSELLGQLSAISLQQFSPDEQVNAAVFRTVLENGLGEARFRQWEMPFNSDSSFWTYLDSRRSLPTPPNISRYIARMREIPRYFDEQIVNMRAGLGRGFSVPEQR